MSFEKFLAAKAAYQVASNRAFVRRDELARELGITLGEAQKHTDYVTLSDESLRLYREVEALAAWLIRANLSAFGLEDLLVTGVLMGKDRTTRLGSVVLPLSELCCIGLSGVADRLGHRHDGVDFSLVVEKDRVRIGHIGSDGDFNYEAAPNLRTTLAWRLATDGGRERLVDIDLDLETKRLLTAIEENGYDEDAFFGPFLEAVTGVVSYQNGSRYSDGDYAALTILWQAATRELGDEHAGYPVEI